jgi:hypothetical protein
VQLKLRIEADTTQAVISGEAPRATEGRAALARCGCPSGRGPSGGAAGRAFGATWGRRLPAAGGPPRSMRCATADPVLATPGFPLAPQATRSPWRRASYRGRALRSSARRRCAR